MPWLKVDDGFESHPKVKTIPRNKRLRAVGLWTLAGSWSARTLTDGHIGPHMLDEFGATKADASQLVAARLWHTTGHDCGVCPQPEENGGYVFHEWHEYQPTREKVEAERAEARERMRRVRGGSSSEDVRPNTDRTSGEVQECSRRPSRPVPSQSRPGPDLAVVTTSSQSPSALDALTDDDWEKIEQATRGPRSHARKVADDVLSKSAGDVTNPRRYILRAVKNEPELYRFHRGNPTRDQECRTHAGEWGDNCRMCAAEAKWGSA